MMIVLGLAYYVRGRIGPARWRSLHRFTALAWVLGVVHTLGEGSDAGAVWFLVTAGALVLPTAALLARRLVAARANTPGSAGPRRACRHRGAHVPPACSPRRAPAGTRLPPPATHRIHADDH